MYQPPLATINQPPTRFHAAHGIRWIQVVRSLPSFRAKFQVFDVADPSGKLRAKAS